MNKSQTVERSLERMISLLREWDAEWEDMKKDMDSKPLNHRHRRIWEGMCNTQMMRIKDLQKLIGEVVWDSRDAGNL